MSKTKDFKSADGRKHPVFIDHELDDYGLSPIEFRVYARIARRAGQAGECSESAPNMAAAFGVGEKTVDRVLLVLCETRLARKQPRPGTTSLYWLNDKTEWLPSTQLQEIRDRIHGNTGKRKAKTGDTPTLGQFSEPGTPRPETGDTPDPTRGTPQTHEVSPLKISEEYISTASPEYRPDPALVDSVTRPNGFDVAASARHGKFEARPGAKRRPPKPVLMEVPADFSVSSHWLRDATMNLSFERGVADIKVQNWVHSRRVLKPRKFPSLEAMADDLKNYLKICGTSNGGSRR